LLTLHRTVVAVSARMTHRSIVDEADAEQYGFRDVNCVRRFWAVNGGSAQQNTGLVIESICLTAAALRPDISGSSRRYIKLGLWEKSGGRGVGCKSTFLTPSRRFGLPAMKTLCKTTGSKPWIPDARTLEVGRSGLSSVGGCNKMSACFGTNCCRHPHSAPHLVRFQDSLTG